MLTAASTTRPLDTGRLSPTTLEDLNSAASLLTRVDRKYLVASSAAQNVVDALTGRALVLDIDGRRSFSYASTYFDTPGLDSYLQAARKRRHRFKIRTRSYLDSGLTFLEVKTRGPRGATIKQRLDYRAADADRLTEEGIDFVVECLAPLTGSAQEARRTAQSLRPVMATTYRRTTLHLPDDDARATIDTDLAWTALAPRSGASSGPPRRPARAGPARPPSGAAHRGPPDRSPSSRRRIRPGTRPRTDTCGPPATGPRGSRSTPPEWRRSTRSCPPTSGTGSSPASWPAPPARPETAPQEPPRDRRRTSSPSRSRAPLARTGPARTGHHRPHNPSRPIPGRPSAGRRMTGTRRHAC